MFCLQVHHVNGQGEDAGVVYCEMQGRENGADDLLDREVCRTLFPGPCGHNAQTGGLLKNLRESTTHAKVKDYHKAFYRQGHAIIK